MADRYAEEISGKKATSVKARRDMKGSMSEAKFLSDMSRAIFHLNGGLIHRARKSQAC